MTKYRQPSPGIIDRMERRVGELTYGFPKLFCACLLCFLIMSMIFALSAIWARMVQLNLQPVAVVFFMACGAILWEVCRAYLERR